MVDYFRRTNRFDELLFSALFLAMAAFMGFFGVRGALLYLGGSRSAPADPVAWSIGIGAALGLIYLALRLLLRWRGDGPLLPDGLLLVCGLAALAGAAWFAGMEHDLTGSYFHDTRTTFFCAGGGVGALVLWWRRVRGGNPEQ